MVKLTLTRCGLSLGLILCSASGKSFQMARQRRSGVGIHSVRTYALDSRAKSETPSAWRARRVAILLSTRMRTRDSRSRRRISWSSSVNTASTASCPGAGAGGAKAGPSSSSEESREKPNVFSGSPAGSTLLRKPSIAESSTAERPRREHKLGPQPAMRRRCCIRHSASLAGGRLSAARTVALA